MAILKNIMLIDDDPALREIGKICLEKLGGFQVDPYRSAEEALPSIAAARPQLILLDVGHAGDVRHGGVARFARPAR